MEQGRLATYSIFLQFWLWYFGCIIALIALITSKKFCINTASELCIWFRSDFEIELINIG